MRKVFFVDIFGSINPWSCFSIVYPSKDLMDFP